MTAATQLDLFGQVEAAEEEAEREAARQAEEEVRKAAELAVWTARFEVAVFRVRIYRDRWETRIGYRCPDPWCASVADRWNLARAHGFDPLQVGETTFDGKCHVVRGWESTTHRLEDVRVTESGDFEARCFCRQVLFYGASQAEMQEQCDEHRAYVTQKKPRRPEWAYWND
jgi:hypothetical protein